MDDNVSDFCRMLGEIVYSVGALLSGVLAWTALVGFLSWACVRAWSYALGL